MNALAPLPVVIPMATAAGVLAINSLGLARLVRTLTAAAIIVEVAIAVVLLYQTRSSSTVYWFGGWTPRNGSALGVSFSIDPIGAGAAAFAGLVTAAALTTMSSVREAVGIVHALVLTLLAAMAGFCLTGDLFNMFVFFELMAVSAFGLVAYHSDRLGPLRSALNLAITNSIGAFLLLIGIAVLYSRTGALNLAAIGHAVALGNVPARLLAVALAVFVVGFLIKAAVVPFHFWLIDTVASAPIGVVIILAGVLDGLGIYGLARLYWTVFAEMPAGHRALQVVLVSIGAITAVAGAALSLAFRDLRRTVAFVMVAHTGIVLIGVGCLTGAGLAGAAIYAISDGPVKVALVLGVCVLALDAPAGEPTETPGLTGRRRRTGTLIVVAGGLALSGFPLFGTGLGKSVIEEAAKQIGFLWVVPLIVIAAATTGAAVMVIGINAYRSAPAHRADGRSWWLPAFVAGLMLSLSAAISLAGSAIAPVAARFVDPAAYSQRVLGLPGGPSRSIQQHLGMTGIGWGLDLTAVALALALAFRLARPRSELRTRSLVFSRAWAAARRAYDGSISDSATWATIGTATVALVLAAWR
jgi:multicomponent Na+:H+ antiporter subunit D